MSNQLHSEYRRWVLEYDYEWVLTLTFPEQQSLRKADEKLRQFMQQVNRKLFTRHHEKSAALSAVVVSEESASQGVHFHMVIQSFDDHGRGARFGGFEQVVKQIWFKLTGAHQVYLERLVGEEHIGKTVNYITKEVYKNTDAVNIDYFFGARGVNSQASKDGGNDVESSTVENGLLEKSSSKGSMISMWFLCEARRVLASVHQVVGGAVNWLRRFITRKKLKINTC